MKKITLFLAFFGLGIFVFLGAGCSLTGETSDENVNLETDVAVFSNVYENSDWGFSVGYPDDWSKQQANENTESLVVSFSSNEFVNTNIEPNRGVTVMASVDSGLTTDFETHAQTIISDIKANETMTYESDSEVELVGQKAYRVIYSQTKDDETFKFLHYFFNTNNKIYQVIYLSAPDIFDEYSQICEDMASSFKIL